MSHIPAPPSQLVLDLGIEVEKTIGGIEMGILENGIPYLTQNGLANIAGVARSTIFDITQEWERSFNEPIQPRGRLSFLKNYLFNNNFNEPKLFIEISKNGSPHYAYPDIVCMAVLEYFAFEAQNKNEKALQNYRDASRLGLQDFIYKALQYSPVNEWKYYQDRVSLLANKVPEGYFIIFNEIAGMIVDLIKAKLIVNDKVIPDISVGRHWANYWNINQLEKEYGPSQIFYHNYPEYYSQSPSNPQPIYAYPDLALSIFRDWFKKQYLPTKFPKYILGKEKYIGSAEKTKKIADLYIPPTLKNN